ncbi:Dynein intermediate chain 2, ciliary [Acromyrmex echinatior]|uniref:Dynein intermediate chain 2, ciliary n=1 Tax=Acromyrmex echinatior TaxID=103372 RepID=F4X2L5_ACREC|nr:Dynein intermediate chain 2, ciliary [Acromyrmex echinatior]
MAPIIPKKIPSKILETSKEHLSAKNYMSRQDLGAGDMDWMRGKQILLKPIDQLQLTEAELQEELARVLTIHNTRVPDSLVEWSWKLRQFVRLPPPPHLVTLLNVIGTILHKDSEEAKVQLAGGTFDEDQEETTDEKLKRDEAEEEEKEEEEEEIDKTVEALAEAEREHELEAEPEPEEDEIEKIKPKKIPNQFNFCERAALTYDNPMRARIFSSMY